MDSDLTGKLVGDKYRIISLIRESDAGDLFNAAHELRETKFILELLPRAFSVDARWAKRFLDRARAASPLSHQNILRVEDYGEDARGNVYAAYEAFDGELLERSMNETRGPIKAVAIAREIASAVEAAHERRVIHGALSPAKVFLSNAGEVKVYGFGGEIFAVPQDRESEHLAPEQRGEYPITDERSDVFAIGTMLERMIFGETVRDQDVDGSIADEAHKELLPVIRTATARDPEMRYRSAKALREDLDRIYTEMGGAAIAARAGRGHNVWQTAFIALCGILILGAVFIYATYSKGSDPTVSLKVEEGSLPVQPINPATGAQEEALLKSAPLGDPNALQDPYLNGATPGGDGYNAWANGVMPPAGAPLSGTSAGPLAGSQFPQNTQNGIPPQAIGPPGERVTVQPGQSVFMPNEGGIILVPVPRDKDQDATPAQKPPANTSTAPSTAPTPKAKPAATPAKAADKPASDTSEVKKPAPSKPAAKKERSEEK